MLLCILAYLDAQNAQNFDNHQLAHYKQRLLSESSQKAGKHIKYVQYRVVFNIEHQKLPQATKTLVYFIYLK